MSVNMPSPTRPRIVSMNKSPPPRVPVRPPGPGSSATSSGVARKKSTVNKHTAHSVMLSRGAPGVAGSYDNMWTDGGGPAPEEGGVGDSGGVDADGVVHHGMEDGLEGTSASHAQIGELSQMLGKADPLVSLQVQGDLFARKIEVERVRGLELDRELGNVRHDTKTQRKRKGKISHAAVDRHSMQKLSIQLENRLEKSKVKFNNTLTRNKELHKEIDDNRKEWLTYTQLSRPPCPHIPAPLHLYFRRTHPKPACCILTTYTMLSSTHANAPSLCNASETRDPKHVLRSCPTHPL